MRTCLNLLIIILLSFICTHLVTVQKLDANEKKKLSANTVAVSGLSTTTFETDHGRIIVNLPTDIVAGDTFSGTVIAKPTGTTPSEQKNNEDELHGYVVDLETNNKRIKNTRVSENELKAVVIPMIETESLVIKLKNGEGRVISSIEVPVKAAITTIPASDDILLPIIAQAGRPMKVIDNRFDGNSSNTVVKIAGEDVVVLAEWPRGIIVQTPIKPIGISEIEINEGGEVMRGMFKNIQKANDFPKTELSGLWRTESGKNIMKLAQDRTGIVGEYIQLAPEEKIRGYRTGVQTIRVSLEGNIVVGETQNFFEIPLQECMALCPSQCEQWNGIMMVLSEDGNRLEGQVEQKGLDTTICLIGQFGWKPWTLIRVERGLQNEIKN